MVNGVCRFGGPDFCSAVRAEMNYTSMCATLNHQTLSSGFVQIFHDVLENDGSHFKFRDDVK